MAPRTAPALETFPDNDMLSLASTLRASHDLRRHSRCHIRCNHRIKDTISQAVAKLVDVNAPNPFLVPHFWNKGHDISG